MVCAVSGRPVMTSVGPVAWLSCRRKGCAGGRTRRRASGRSVDRRRNSAARCRRRCTSCRDGSRWSGPSGQGMGRARHHGGLVSGPSLWSGAGPRWCGWARPGSSRARPAHVVRLLVSLPDQRDDTAHDQHYAGEHHWRVLCLRIVARMRCSAHLVANHAALATMMPSVKRATIIGWPAS